MRNMDFYMEYVKITKNDLNSLIEKRVTPSLAHLFSEKAYPVRLTMAEVFSFVRQYEELLLKWGSDAFYVQKGYQSQQCLLIFEKRICFIL